MNSLEKFEREVQRLATRYGMELIADRAYANTGTLRVQWQNSFDDLLTIKYDFQASDVTLSIDGHKLYGARGAILQTALHDVAVKLLRERRKAQAEGDE